ncbi:cbb3-type cytochrome c oxidase subunit 3 [Rhodanobacter sp. DHB23]|uniref:cbb3-type cytochrome oxidase subunit 3 n=1 Tax=Rhodanobacter sp. DHB23 TaxID=2775923 RepID=UPI0017807256|nr:cbb3-type cytochrome c oxidase subunit 3 [Rhodanobacter sp. DHB23]MBD8873319.1 cbb3-type cytochrome c oxidase subunit 3 [Rhodanobacter sp. DHB23]
MNPFWGHLAGVLIVLMMVSFVGIWIWAWRRYHKPVFDRMAQLPMQDDDIPAGDATQEGTR